MASLLGGRFIRQRQRPGAVVASGLSRTSPQRQHLHGMMCARQKRRIAGAFGDLQSLSDISVGLAGASGIEQHGASAEIQQRRSCGVARGCGQAAIVMRDRVFVASSEKRCNAEASLVSTYTREVATCIGRSGGANPEIGRGGVVADALLGTRQQVADVFAIQFGRAGIFCNRMRCLEHVERFAVRPAVKRRASRRDEIPERARGLRR
jgi:hypothetical protein